MDGPATATDWVRTSSTARRTSRPTRTAGTARIQTAASQNNILLQNYYHNYVPCHVNDYFKQLNLGYNIHNC
jgi:hypothetical protein